MKIINLSPLLLLLFAASCTEPIENDSEITPGDTPADSTTGNDMGNDDSDDGEDNVVSLNLPSWQLEDIQPQSERFGDVYGLDHFSGEVLVALLVEGN